MADKNTIAQDWENVGKDFQNATGIESCDDNALHALLKAVRALNPLNAIFVHECKHR